MLNKKGFAFSTMLYGVLSLIMIVLLLLFGVLQSSDQESEYYTSVIEKNMSKCVNEEIALELLFLFITLWVERFTTSVSITGICLNIPERHLLRM